jgi:hypothetical protein
MFLARSARRFCVISDWDRRVAASCSPYVGSFFDNNVTVMIRRVLFGAADDSVARVIVVGSQGRRHAVPLSRDGGFIYDCEAYAGCGSVVDHVEAYAADGALIGFAG